MEGQTATNPQTGEKIIFRGGQWQPLNGGPARSGPISSGSKPVDPLRNAADARDQTRLDILIANEERRAADDAKKVADEADKEKRQKAAMLSRFKDDARNIARLGKDANDNYGLGETGTSGALSRAILPAGTAGYSLDADIKTFQAKNAFAGLNELASQGIKLTPISNEEVKLAAASIANLDPNADHETFMRAVDQTKQYYYDAIARIDPLEAYQTALENGEDAQSIIAIAQRNGGPMPDPEFLQKAVDYTKQGGKPSPNTFQPPETPPDSPSGGGLGQALYAGVGDIAQGLGEFAGIVGNPLNAGINAIAGTNLSTDLGQTFRDATGAPQGDPLASAINRGGTAALTMAGAAGAARPFVQGTTRAVTNALAAQPVQQVVGGMSAGGAAEGARQAGAPAPVQAGAGLLGGVLGYGGANAMMSGVEAARAAPNALAPQIVSEAKRAKVPLMTTDAIPPRTVVGKTARKVGEVIPIAGTGSMRVKQQEARVEAVKQLAREFETDEASLAAVTKDLTAERSRQITTLTSQKEQILNNVTAPAAAPRAIAMLDQQIAAASKVQTSGSQALVAKLQDFKKALSSGTNTLRELEAIRKEMGTAFKDPSLANIADAGQKAVRSIYGPLRDDMAATIRKVAGDETAKTWRVANARLSGMADELQSTALKSTLNKASSTPEDVAKLLFSAKPSQVRLLYNNLSAEGRAKAQGVIIAKALEKAGDDVSPNKFENELKKMASNIGVFFQGPDLARVNGLQRVLEATRRASDAGFQPETGAQLTPWVAPAALTAVFGAKGGLAAAGGYGVMARIYESAPVRDALLKLGRTRPGSPQERAMLPKVSAALIAANENSAQYVNNAPGLSQAAASEQVGEKRPIQP